MVDFQRAIKKLFKERLHVRCNNYTTSKKLLRECIVPHKQLDYVQTLLLEQTDLQEEGAKIDVHLQEKRKNALEVLDALMVQKQELFELQMKFRQDLRKFHKDVIMNHEKRERSIQKIKDRRRQIQIRQEEIDKIKEQSLTIENYKTIFDKEIDKYDIYETFLQQAVMLNSEYFNDSEENVAVFRQFIILLHTRQELMERDRISDELMQKLRANLMDFSKQNLAIYTNLYTLMIFQGIKYRRARRKTCEIETKIENIREECKKKFLDSFLAIQSLYEMNKAMCLRMSQHGMNIRNIRLYENQDLSPFCRRILEFKNHLIVIHRIWKRLEKQAIVFKAKEEIESEDEEKEQHKFQIVIHDKTIDT